MKKILLTFIGLLAVLLTANADMVEKSYTLSFLSKSSDNSSAMTTSTALGNIFESGAEYVSGITATNNAYPNSVNGIKFGSSSKDGAVTFALAEAGQVKVTKLIVTWSSFNTTAASQTYSINGTEVGSTGSYNSKDLKETTIKVENPEVATSLTIASTKRSYVKSVILYYYEEVSGPVAPQYSNVPANVKLTVGDKMDYPAIEPSDLTYSFSAEPAGILTFDDAAKTITAAGIGTATVKFTTAAMGDYEAGEGSFEVEVVGKTPELSFANPVVYGKVGSGVVWQTVTITEPAHTDAKVTYTSSDPEIVAVDATTGRINVADVKKAGEVVITATLAAEGDYAEGTASYTINIVEDTSEGGDLEPSYTLTFLSRSSDNSSAMTTSTALGNIFESGAEYVSGITATNNAYPNSVNGLKFSSAKVNGAVAFDLSEAGQVKVTKLELEWAKYGSDAGSLDVSINGTSIGDTGATDSSSLSKIVFEIENPVVATSISLQATKRCYVKSITVYYEGTALKSPNLTFEKNDYSMMVGEATTINAATAPEGVEVVYAIEGLNADEYSITEDGTNLNVTVDKAGYYTLTAKSAATDEYTDGFEIMRLNVYAPVTAYADGEEITSNTFEAEVEGDEDTVTITFDLPANDYLYYKLESTAVTTVKEADAESEDENQLPGYTLYKDGIEIPAGFNGTLSYYQANYGFLSPVKTLAISIPTGVAEIAIDEEGAVRYYDLNGREVKGQLDSGIYVRLRNGKATKILVK